MPWLIIKAEREEGKTSSALTNVGIRNFNFKYNERSVIRGRLCDHLVQMFPNYLFVDIAADWMWRAIVGSYMDRVEFLRSFHVGRAIGTVAGPSVVRAREIDELLKESDQHGILPYVSPSKFNTGDKIYICENNSLYGFEGVYQGSAKPGRSVVNVRWLADTVCPVEVADEDIELVNPVRQRQRRDRGRHRRGGRRWRERRERKLNTAQPLAAA